MAMCGLAAKVKTEFMAAALKTADNSKKSAHLETLFSKTKVSHNS
jgi:hypothetical protein